MAEVRVLQVQDEYTTANNFIKSRKAIQSNQLALFNNLQRGDEMIASDLLHSFFNRSLSDLYDDRIQIKFMPGEDSDHKKTEMLNKVAVNDYSEMDKKKIDYDWLWDTCFFGRGYLETLRFDRQRLIMVPRVINPLMLVHDPNFASVQDWRHYGKWITKTGVELRHLIQTGAITGITDLREIQAGMDADIWNYKASQEQAKGGTPQPNDEQNRMSPSHNAIYQLLEWFTYDHDGNKCIYWMDKNLTKILMCRPIDLRDGEDGQSSLWPLVAKEIFRDPHSTLPLSIPDLIEDKHRMLNVLLNLMYLAAKDEANPIYGFDINMVQDVTQLYQRQIQQHIAVKGNPADAIGPLRNSPAASNSLLSFISMMKGEAGESIGTTQLQMPQKQGKKTASEAAMLQMMSDLMKSLQGRITAFGEQEFWSHWYHRYMRYMPAAKRKFITVTSGTSTTFESFAKEEIQTKYPPKVQVNSAKEAEYKEMVERRDFMSMFPTLQQFLDPQGMKAFAKHVLFPKFQTVDSSQVDAMLPSTVDEIAAEEENDLLNDDVLPDIHPGDDDVTHLYIHARARRTPATWAHILTHRKQYADKQAQKAATPPPAQPGQDQGQGASPDQGQQIDNQAAATPNAKPMSESMPVPQPNV